MAKRKVKSKLLTKGDPGILKPKSLGISQHAAKNGVHVTTTVNPVWTTLATPLSEPFGFDANPSSFAEEPLDGDDDDGNVEGFLKEFFAAQVCSFSSP